MLSGISTMKTTVKSNSNIRAHDIVWGRGSSFNLGTIHGCNFGCERYKTPDNKWKFIINRRDGGPWYVHYDKKEYDTATELEYAIAEWVRDN